VLCAHSTGILSQIARCRPRSCVWRSLCAAVNHRPFLPRVSEMNDPKKGLASKKRILWGHGRVAFLAHSAAIRAQLALGRSKMDVWREFCDRLGGLEYSRFTRYVANKTMVATPPPPLLAAELSPPRAQTEPREPLGAGSRKKEQGFHFDPMDAYRQDY
jgi:hypothetical protein